MDAGPRRWFHNRTSRHCRVSAAMSVFDWRSRLTLANSVQLYSHCSKVAIPTGFFAASTTRCKLLLLRGDSISLSQQTGPSRVSTACSMQIIDAVSKPRTAIDFAHLPSVLLARLTRAMRMRSPLSASKAPLLAAVLMDKMTVALVDLMPARCRPEARY